MVSVESSSSENVVGFNGALGRAGDGNSGVERFEYTFDRLAFGSRDEVTLVEDEYVAKLDLFGEEVRKRSRAIICRLDRMTVDERLMELCGINHRYGRIEIVQR